MDEFKTFPANADEALALLYLQNQDLSETSPERLAEWYEELKKTIHTARRSSRGSQQITL